MTPVFYLAAFVAFLCGMGLLACIMLTRTSRAAAERLFEVTDQDILIERRRFSINEWKRS
jgi:hypothetical protein